VNLQALGRPGDRRAYPRVTCTLSRAPSPASATAGAQRLRRRRLRRAARDPGPSRRATSTCASPSATRRSSCPPRSSASPPSRPRASASRIQFRGVSDTASEQIHRFVLGRLLAEIAEIMEGDPRPVDPRNVQLVHSVESVAALPAPDDRGRGPRPRQPLPARRRRARRHPAGRRRPPRGRRPLRDPSARRPETGDHIHLTLTRGSFNAHAHTTVRGRSGERVSLDVPASLTVFELRRAPRRAPTAEEMFVAIPVPYPPGRKLRCEVLDISSTGLAFKLARDAPYFLPGTPCARSPSSAPAATASAASRRRSCTSPPSTTPPATSTMSASASTSASPTTPSPRAPARAPAARSARPASSRRWAS
jgi:hypothetical protein